MTRVLVPPDTPCVVSDFDPADDILVIALPEDPGGGLDHGLTLHHDRKRGFLQVTLHHTASGARFVVCLPGVQRLDPAAIAVLSLAEAEQLAPAAPPPDTATLTGDGVYPAPPGRTARTAPGRRKVAFVHRHSWHRDGPPNEQFFDLSDPESELDIRLAPDTGGPIYAIRLTEKTGDPEGGSFDQQHSIVLAQTAPGTPPLSTGLLAQWFATRMGSPDFRVIAWVWLGNRGHFTDPATGRRRRFGQVNDSPRLGIHGALAGSIAIER